MEYEDYLKEIDRIEREIELCTSERDIEELQNQLLDLWNQCKNEKIV